MADRSGFHSHGRYASLEGDIGELRTITSVDKKAGLKELRLIAFCSFSTPRESGVNRSPTDIFEPFCNAFRRTVICYI